MLLMVLATGKCRDAHIRALEDQYWQRLPANVWRVQVRELPDAATPEEEAPAQLAALAALPQPNIKILLDERGKQVASRGLAEKFGAWRGQGVKAVAVVIGGANGTSEKVEQAIDWTLSFGALTLPHQLVRVVLAEQVYRVHTLLVGHPYHRD